MPAAGVPESTPPANVTPVGSAPVRAMVGAGVPVAVTVNEPATPTTNVVLAALVMVGLLGMLALLAQPRLIADAYTADTDITSMAVTLIRLAALFIAIDSAQVAATFCLRALKDTHFPFLTMCIAYWLITLPLGYWLGIVTADNPLQGTVAFWQSMIAGITVALVLVFTRLYWRLRQPLSKAD